MKFLILPILLFFNVAGCHKDIVPAGNTDYAGNWKGTFTGSGDNGSWDLTIASNGNITGSITSILFSQTSSAIGTVNPAGQVTVTVGSSSSGITFSGTITGRNVSGAWTNNSRTPALNGTWSGTKQ
jgi:hypothetical protein